MPPTQKGQLAASFITGLTQGILQRRQRKRDERERREAEDRALGERALAQTETRIGGGIEARGISAGQSPAEISAELSSVGGQQGLNLAPSPEFTRFTFQSALDKQRAERRSAEAKTEAATKTQSDLAALQATIMSADEVAQALNTDDLEEIDFFANQPLSGIKQKMFLARHAQSIKSPKVRDLDDLFVEIDLAARRLQETPEGQVIRLLTAQRMQEADAAGKRIGVSEALTFEMAFADVRRLKEETSLESSGPYMPGTDASVGLGDTAPVNWIPGELANSALRVEWFKRPEGVAGPVAGPLPLVASEDVTLAARQLNFSEDDIDTIFEQITAQPRNAALAALPPPDPDEPLTIGGLPKFIGGGIKPVTRFARRVAKDIAATPINPLAGRGVSDVFPTGEEIKAIPGQLAGDVRDVAGEAGRTLESTARGFKEGFRETGRVARRTFEGVSDVVIGELRPESVPGAGAAAGGPTGPVSFEDFVSTRYRTTDLNRFVAASVGQTTERFQGISVDLPGRRFDQPLLKGPPTMTPNDAADELVRRKIIRSGQRESFLRTLYSRSGFARGR